MSKPFKFNLRVAPLKVVPDPYWPEVETITEVYARRCNLIIDGWMLGRFKEFAPSPRVGRWIERAYYRRRLWLLRFLALISGISAEILFDAGRGQRIITIRRCGRVVARKIFKD